MEPQLWKQLEKHIIYFTNLENAFVEDFIEENRGELYGFQNVSSFVSMIMIFFERKGSVTKDWRAKSYSSYTSTGW